MGMESLPTGASAPPADLCRAPCPREETERLVELDPSLVPTGPSALLVEPSVLDPEEVRALLADLGALLAGAAHPPALSAAPIGTWLGSLFGGPDGNAQDGDVQDAEDNDGEALLILEGEGERRRQHPHEHPGQAPGGWTYEPHPATVGRGRRDPQLPSPARLFADDAGAGRPARHQQGHHLRARRRAGKEARAEAGQAQGSLFGDHR